MADAELEDTNRIDREEVDKVAREEAERASREASEHAAAGGTAERPSLSTFGLRRLRGMSRRRPPG